MMKSKMYNNYCFGTWWYIVNSTLDRVQGVPYFLPVFCNVKWLTVRVPPDIEVVFTIVTFDLFVPPFLIPLSSDLLTLETFNNCYVPLS